MLSSPLVDEQHSFHEGRAIHKCYSQPIHWQGGCHEVHSHNAHIITVGYSDCQRTVSSTPVPTQSRKPWPFPPQKELIGPNLEPFAGAYKEVSQIHTAYKQRIIQAKDPAQTDALQQEANQKMNQAVADHGLTIADYNKIFQSIQNDPELKEEFMTVLNRTR